MLHIVEDEIGDFKVLYESEVTNEHIHEPIDNTMTIGYLHSVYGKNNTIAIIDSFLKKISRRPHANN